MHNGENVEVSRVQLLQPHGVYSPWNSPGQNTGEYWSG